MSKPDDLLIELIADHAQRSDVERLHEHLLELRKDAERWRWVMRVAANPGEALRVVDEAITKQKL